MQKPISSRPALVVLHGWTLDPTVTKKWQPFISLLEKSGLDVKFWRLPGLTVDAQQAYTLQDYVDWLEEKTKNLEPFILLGHSFGGQLAVRFTRLHPERVIKLVLIDSSGILDSSIVKVLKRSIFKAIAKAGKKFTASALVRKWFYRLVRETDYYRANEFQRQTMSNILPDEIRVDLGHITAPAFIVWGENDSTTPLAVAAAIFQKNIPHSRIAVIPEARHSPIYTHPRETFAALNAFLKE